MPSSTDQQTRPRRDVPTDRPGEHVWALMAMWRFDPSQPMPRNGDLVAVAPDQLLGIAGPGCFVCQEVYTPEVAARPCPGEPTDA